MYRVPPAQLSLTYESFKTSNSVLVIIEMRVSGHLVPVFSALSHLCYLDPAPSLVGRAKAVAKLNPVTKIRELHFCFPFNELLHNGENKGFLYDRMGDVFYSEVLRIFGLHNLFTSAGSRLMRAV